MDSLFVVVVVAIISISTRPSPSLRQETALFPHPSRYLVSTRDEDLRVFRVPSMVAVIVNSSADERSIAEMHARSMGGYYIWLRGYKMDYTIPRFFVEIRRSFENFLLKMTIYMHSASQFPVFVVIG